jgi:hypothetical protein
MDSVLVRLQDWYVARCNRDPEHQRDVTIIRLDSVWTAHFALNDTAKENAAVDWV